MRIFKRCRLLATKFKEQLLQLVHVVTDGVPAAVKKLPVLFDALKYVILWVVELGAFASSGLLLAVGVMSFIQGDARTGIVVLLGCYLALGLSVLISVATGEISITSQKEQKG